MEWKITSAATTQWCDTLPNALTAFYREVLCSHNVEIHYGSRSYTDEVRELMWSISLYVSGRPLTGPIILRGLRHEYLVWGGDADGEIVGSVGPHAVYGCEEEAAMVAALSGNGVQTFPIHQDVEEYRRIRKSLTLLPGGTSLMGDR